MHSSSFKYTCGTAALLALCLAAGCGKQKEKIDITPAQTTQAQEATMAQKPSSQQTEIAIEETSPASSDSSATSGGQASLADKLSSKTYSKGSVSVTYPEVLYVDDSARAAEINETLKNHALAFLNAYEINEATDTVTITFKPVSADRNRFSVVYTGSIMKKGSAYPTQVFFTDTIDLKTGHSLSLKDYADPYTLAGYVLSDDCYFVSESDSLTEDLRSALMDSRRNMTLDQYTSMFQKADFPNMDPKKGYFPETFSYESAGSIIFSIPVSHALGDYALVSFTPEGK